MKKSVAGHLFVFVPSPGASFAHRHSDIRAGSKAKGPRLPAASIHQMVKNVAWNEFQASEHPTHFYRYLERDISADGSTTTDIVATSHGEVARLIEVNNHPPDRAATQEKSTTA